MREKKEINQRIGANMKAVREEFGYTQEELSEALNVTPQHLSALERGVFGSSLELIDKLCCFLDISADRILFGVQNKKNASNDFAAEIGRMLERVPGRKRLQLKKIILEILEFSGENK